MNIFSEAIDFWSVKSPSLTDEGEIFSKVVSDYALANNAETKAKIHLIWSAWPGVANKLGGWDPKNQKPFLDELTRVTNLSYLQIAPIASAINDLGKSGKLAQKKVDPQRYIESAKQTEQAMEATSKSSPSVLSSIFGIAPSTVSWIKWGVVGIGAITLLILIRPYTSPILAGVKNISSKLKKNNEGE